MSLAIRTFFFLLLLLALNGVWVLFIATSGLRDLNDAVEHNQFPDGLQGSLSFTSIRSIDKHILSLVMFNMPMVSKESPIASARLFMGEFVASMLVVIMLLAIEASYQEKSKPYPQTFMWLFLVATTTSAVALPIYCLGTAIPVTRNTRTGHVSSILPGIIGVVGGYAIPAGLMFDPFDFGPIAQSRCVAAFALFPFGVQMVASFTRGVIALLPSRESPSRRYVSAYHMIQITHLLTGAVAVFHHYLAVASVIHHPHLSLKGLYFPTSNTTTLSGKIFVFLQIDYGLTSAVLLLWMFSKLRACEVMHPALLFPALVFGTGLLGLGGVVAVCSVYYERWVFLQLESTVVREGKGM
ncbi:hypothetical protein EG327_007871 [Venturia inaequalis]|uniref:Uncharacterized protein n=1 Tax=Venturia inaequalis TaxID=5025 RepID=A0A8H3UVF1_VENIN|nr:hypothetical protein EG327_007871 [Venturia inaequalis]